MSTSSFPLFRLMVLAGAIFAAVSSEFLPTGLLPEMSAELGVSEARIGLLVTVFAATVVVSTAPLTLLTHRYSRKWLMVLLLGFFAFTNVLCAIAPSYEFLLVARVLGGLAHGLFWAVTGPYASRLVPRSQLVRALSITSFGATAAFVLGVPFGTFLGHAMGWRLAFAAMAVIVVVFMVFVVVYLPPVSHLVPLATGEIPLPMRKDRSLPAIAIVCVNVMIVIMGYYVYYTYIAPWAIQVGGFDEEWVSGLLFLFGAAGAIGIALAGAFGDRFPRAAVNAALVGTVASLLFIFAFGTSVVPVLVGMVLWGALYGGVPSLLNSRALQAASDRARDIASAAISTAWNIAIGVGSLIGAGVLDTIGIVWLPAIAAVFMAGGLLFALATDRARTAVRG